MQQPSFLTEIVDSYELSPKLRRRILRIASRRLAGAGITSFNGTYEHITSLVEKFKNHPNQISLATLFSDEDTRTLSSILGKEDPNLLNLVEGFNDENQKTFSAREAVYLLQDHLEPHLLTVLKTIAARAPSLPLPTDPEHAIHSLPRIREKLQALHDRYRYKGTFQLPPRPIKHVDFDSSEIIAFGRRTFNGDPLAYFKEHEDFYQGLNRTQLSKIDRALHFALLRTGQINEAIPSVRKSPLGKSYSRQKFARFNGDPLAYFKEHEEKYRGLSRSDFQIKDRLLYDALRKTNQLAEAIPITKTMKDALTPQKDPLGYYKAHPERYAGITLEELKRIHFYIYKRLQKRGKLEEALAYFTKNNQLSLPQRTYVSVENPPAQEGFRTSSDALAYFKEHPEYHKLTRTHLSKTDNGLYRALHATHAMNNAIPPRRPYKIKDLNPAQVIKKPVQYRPFHFDNLESLTTVQEKSFPFTGGRVSAYPFDLD